MPGLPSGHRPGHHPLRRRDPHRGPPGRRLWPFHLHALIRSTIIGADDQTDDRWSETDWAQAAARAFTALGDQWTHGPERDRLQFIGCLRLARDFGLKLNWLIEGAFSYVGDSVWEPLAPPARETDTALHTPAEALVEMLSALARRQHEHRAHTVNRLTAIIDSHLLPAELHEMAVYYRAKAYRDIGQSADSRRGYQQVADGTGRLAPAARRGLAQAARLAGDFPTAYATAQTWAGKDDTSEYWATSGGYRESQHARPPPTWPGASKPNSTQKLAKPHTTRPCEPSPSPSSTPTRPTTNSTWPNNSSHT